MPFPTPEAAQDTSGARVSRRRMLAGAAWSAPLILTAAAVPQAAASTCPAINGTDSWTITTGPGLQPSTEQNTNRWGGSRLGLGGPFRNANSYISLQDNATAAPLTIALRSSFRAMQGRPYSFEFRVRNNADQTRAQAVSFSVGGELLFSGATKLPGAGQVVLPGSVTNGQSYTVPTSAWVAPATGEVSLEIVFTLPGGSGTNDDIRISLPVLTGAGCP